MGVGYSIVGVAHAGCMAGDRIDNTTADQAKHRIEAAGYRNVPQVGEPGDFAVRGALIDIFAMGANEPYRVELFDDEVESIRTFDTETQRSQQQVDSVDLLPAREFPVTEEAAKNFRANLRERFPMVVKDETLWPEIKLVYIGLLHDHHQPECAETFYNSVTRKVFTTVGVDAEREYVRTVTDDRRAPSGPA